MSWAAHEFENYFIQKHAGAKASFLAIVLGTMVPDAFTKKWVYMADEPAHFHRAFPGGIGYTHSLIFGLGIAVVVLAVTRSRTWALGLLLGQWAHVFTDVTDSAGTLVFWPFSDENVSIGMWRHAASAGRFGDAAAYYSSLGGIWDFFWFLMIVFTAREVLRADYFHKVIVPTDARIWGWLHTKLRLPWHALLIVYRTWFLYAFSRMMSWFIFARFDVKAPWEPHWDGPSYVVPTDLSTASFVEVLIKTVIGGVLFAVFVAACWWLFIRRLWAWAGLSRRSDSSIAEA